MFLLALKHSACFFWREFSRNPPLIFFGREFSRNPPYTLFVSHESEGMEIYKDKKFLVNRTSTVWYLCQRGGKA